jgi:hypothetical protein
MGSGRLTGDGLVAVTESTARRYQREIGETPTGVSTQSKNPVAKSSRTARLIVRENIVQVISHYNHESVIAEYIRTKGVTRCPTACVVPTQASVNKADRAALEEYAVERDRQRREKATARARLFWSADLSLPPNTK